MENTENRKDEQLIDHSYPEGYAEAAADLDMLPEEARAPFLFGFLLGVMMQ